MKRAMTGENDFDQNKRSRSSNRSSYEDALADGKFEIRLLIPSKSAGAVIGKGGAFIKDIRTKVNQRSVRYKMAMVLIHIKV